MLGTVQAPGWSGDERPSSWERGRKPGSAQGKGRRRNLGGLHPRCLGILHPPVHHWYPHLVPPPPKGPFPHLPVIPWRRGFRSLPRTLIGGGGACIHWGTLIGSVGGGAYASLAPPPGLEKEVEPVRPGPLRGALPGESLLGPPEGKDCQSPDGGHVSSDMGREKTERPDNR